MVCQTNQAKTTWKIPDVPKCEALLGNPVDDPLLEAPQRADIQLYKRNIEQHRVKAFLCQRIRRIVVTELSFFGYGTTHHDEKVYKRVTAQECERMLYFHQCGEEEMVQGKRETWHTQNIRYPSWEWCCHKHYFIWENCFLIPVHIYKTYEDPVMQASIKESVRHCDYELGNCTLEDGSQLIWNPPKESTCEYIEDVELTGQKYGPNWLADQGSLAFTLTEPGVATDCYGDNITINDQLMAFKFTRLDNASGLNVL